MINFRTFGRVRTWAFVLVFILSNLTAGIASSQSGNLPDNWTVFGCKSISNRLILITRFGDEAERTFECAIVELTEPEERLRVLHYVRTRSRFSPLVTAGSPCGRFIVTLNEWKGVGISKRDLVIYDLVRAEYSAYGISDFLADDTISSLKPHAFIPGIEWFRGGAAFDVTSMRFYPTLPKERRRPNLPFVIVDLPTRGVHEKPIPDHDIERGQAESSYFSSGCWLCSMGGEPLPGSHEPLRLPAFLRVEYGDEGIRQRRVFRLDAESGDYLAVPEADWPDEKLPMITAGMYREAKSEWEAQRQ